MTSYQRIGLPDHDECPEGFENGAQEVTKNHSEHSRIAAQVPGRPNTARRLRPACLLIHSAVCLPLLKDWPGIQFVEDLHEPGAIAIAQLDIREHLDPFWLAVERFQDGAHLAQIGCDRFVS